MEREYAFLSYMVPQGLKERVYRNSKKSMQDAADALQWHIYKGLCENMQCNIKIINVLPIFSYPQYYKKPFVNWCKFDTCYNHGNVNVGFCNVKLIREYSKTASIYRALKKWLESSDKPKTLFLYTASGVFLKAIARLKKHHDIRVCVIIADLPNMINLSSKKSFLLKWWSKRHSNEVYELLSVADSYVLLTKYMAEYMNLQKPFCVMEGIATASQQFPIPEYHSDLKTVFYAGTLHRKFGILNLLEAFQRIPDADYQLILCGVGDSEQEIKAAAERDSRIKFYGVLPRDEVLKLQTKATVLVNPRQNNEKFTKYSFPSKNLEYLSSGIPFIAYKLDGIPDEYDDYILYVEDDDIASLTQKIVNVCELSDAEREAIGQKARLFVTEQKNEIVQTGKILSFLGIGGEKDGYKPGNWGKSPSNPTEI